MGELLEALANIAIVAALFGVLALALYHFVGPQAFGLPAMLGAFVIVAGAEVIGNVGVRGIVFILLGLAALVVVIGMAMSVADRRPGGGGEPRAAQETQPVQEPARPRSRTPGPE